MTALGRTIVAVAAIISATVMGVVLRDATLPTAILGTASGFVFGDRNAERRIANAVNVLGAEQSVDMLVEQSLDRRRARRAADIPPAIDIRESNGPTDSMVR